MKLSDLIEYILDETSNNRLTLHFERDEDGTIAVTIQDKLSDIGYVYNQGSMDDALNQMQEQMQSFVDERMASK